MRPATTAVQSLLANWSPMSQVALADLYTFTLQTGEVLRYSSRQRAIDAPAPNTSTPLLHYSRGPAISRNKLKTQIGTHVDELEIDVFAGQNDLIGTLTWQQVAWAGLFDGAYCELDRCFMSPPGTVIGTITWFYGRVADIDIGRTRLNIKVKSLLDLLTIQMPKRLFQSTCTFVFGDASCKYDRVAGKNGLGVSTGFGSVPITCLAGSTQNAIITSFDASTTGAYNNGTIISTSGLNNGFQRTLAALESGTCWILKPWAYPVVAGVDTFDLLPGCDHTVNTCNTVFENVAFFGGFPYIPPPETAL